MARPIVLGNGEMHVGINKFGLVHDLYYPYVGLENHAAEGVLRHHIGIWIDGKISWLDDGNWTVSQGYPHESLIGHTKAKNDKIGIVLEFDDCVDADMSAFMRNIHVVNLRDEAREVRLFLHQAFIIGDSRSNTDTAQYLPDSHAVLHYRGRRVFMVSASSNGEYFDQYSVGLFGSEEYQGTWRDAEDGELSMSNVEHGRVDSTLRFALQLGSHDSQRVHYWIAAGTSTREALFVFKQIQKHGVDERLASTQKSWQKWLEPAKSVVGRLPAQHQKSFLDSIMIVKSHIDKRGAVIASTDSSILKYWRDAYAYCWPRDGAYAVWPFVRMGYKDEPHQFFEFCRRSLHPGGYLMHKYRADGALGSSWHPYIHNDGQPAPPIQEDETALTLFVFVQFYQTNPSPQLLREFYEPLVVPMADFLSGYIDQRTNLPKPSYDLWEENYLTSTYTTSVVYAALQAAAELAEVANDSEHAVKWRSVSEDIYEAAKTYLYDPERGAFYKGILHKDDGSIEYNKIIDVSSIYGAFMFGLFPADSIEIQRSIETMYNAFGVDGAEKGLPRYENDSYLRADGSSQGNAWLLTTLWMAQYYLEVGQTDKTDAILEWVKLQSHESGVMSEQIDPSGNESISVAPLAWSHTEYIATLLDTITEHK